ncbi:hypothetical protein NAC44_11905 [Allorhizobium sp. BGMRC 0089]|uniref:hypothetical protein n=1 Tax=Allorhizobium sonneratiae TaxID=2934936 RepID=UPI0020348F3C|nr:hypothetical protein [Allorhizobium sonneratiae]MCM2293026.1 hypothetical protein [Allorhizobium sonneratiae]
MTTRQVKRAVFDLPRPERIFGGVHDGDDSAEINRRVQAMDAWSSTSLKSPPAEYDPIFTPLFTAIGLTGSVTIGATTITTAAIASAIATTALSIGLQLLLTPKPPKPDDGKVPVTQAIPYRIWAVGRCRLAGAYMLWEAKGEALYAVQAVCGHKVRSFNRFWLHDDEVTDHIGSDGFLTYTGEPYENNVRIWTRLGNVPEAPYDYIVNGYPGVDGLGAEGIWTLNHRLDGTASMAFVAQQTKASLQASRFPYGAPRLTTEGDWAFVWDFRDSSQDPDNDSTWAWSKNSVLILAWHLCFNPYGERRDYKKAILPILDMWQEEADICDETIATAAGGSFPRYECSGWDTTEHDPKVGMNAILATCDGWICYRGDGAVLITVGKFRESRVVTLMDEDILGYAIQHDTLPQDACNRLVPKFTYPDTDYTSSDTDFWEDEDAQAVDGRVLAKEADYSWCTNWRQARMLGKRDWLRVQEKIKGSIDVRLSGLNAIYARWVRLSTPLGLPRYDGMLIENKRSVLALNKGGFTMDFIRQPDNIDAWTPATDEGAQPPVPDKPNAANMNTPTIYSVASYTVSGYANLTVKVVDPENDAWTLALRYRLADDGSGTAGGWSANITYDNVDPADGYLTATIGGLAGDATYEVQAAFFNTKNKYSDWSATYSVSTISDPVAAAVPTNVDATGGTGEATFSWTAPNDTHYSSGKIYVNTVNVFSSASFEGPLVYGSANNSYSESRTLSSGIYYGWIASVNVSGIESDPAATGSFTVL